MVSPCSGGGQLLQLSTPWLAWSVACWRCMARDWPFQRHKSGLQQRQPALPGSCASVCIGAQSVLAAAGVQLLVEATTLIEAHITFASAHGQLPATTAGPYNFMFPDLQRRQPTCSNMHPACRGGQPHMRKTMDSSVATNSQNYFIINID